MASVPSQHKDCSVDDENEFTWSPPKRRKLGVIQERTTYSQVQYVEADHFDPNLNSDWKRGYIMNHHDYVFDDLDLPPLSTCNRTKSVHIEKRTENKNKNKLLNREGFFQMDVKGCCIKGEGGLDWDHKKLARLQSDKGLSENQRIAAKELIALHKRAKKYTRLLKRSEVPVGTEGDHGVPVAVGGADTASNLYCITPEDHTLVACLVACLFANKPLSDMHTIRFYFKGSLSQHPQFVIYKVSVRDIIQRRDPALLHIITQAHIQAHINGIRDDVTWNKHLEELKECKALHGILLSSSCSTRKSTSWQVGEMATPTLQVRKAFR